MSFIKDLYHDEIRDGYLVTASIKKYWNRYLEIVAEVDRICRKHKIKYWAAYGTLLGAVRHNGFIPWDEDLDLCMLRPEFKRFCKIIEDELKQSNVFALKEILLGLIRIGHSQTTLMDKTYYENKPQIIAIDIFALDVAPDSTPKSSLAYQAFNEVLYAAYDYPNIVINVQKGSLKLVNDLSTLKTVFDLPEEKRMPFIDFYLEGLFNQSSSVAWMQDTMKNYSPFKKDWFNETIYLPFETIELPAPADYDEVLTSYYGDWRTPIPDGHSRKGSLITADIPWQEFMQRADLNLNLP